MKKAFKPIGSRGVVQTCSDQADEALVNAVQQVSPKEIFSSRLASSLKEVKPIDFEETRRSRCEIEAILSSEKCNLEEYKRVFHMEDGLRANMSRGLRIELRREIASNLDDGKVVVLVAPGGFGKTKTMIEFNRNVGGHIAYFDSSLSVQKNMDKEAEHIKKARMVFFDEFGYLTGEMMDAVEKVRGEGKGVVVGVRPLGYFDFGERNIRGKRDYREIFFNALDVHDEKRIVDGVGLDKKTGERLMAFAQGDPNAYWLLFTGDTFNMKYIVKFLDDMDKLLKGESTGNTCYSPERGNIDYFNSGGNYLGMLPAVKKIALGEPVSTQEEKLALGSGLILQREGKIYAPPITKYFAENIPEALEEKKHRGY